MKVETKLILLLTAVQSLRLAADLAALAQRRAA
jgi:hypothetical protein